MISVLLCVVCLAALHANAYKLTASGGAAKGIVGALTDLTNFVSSPATTSAARQRKYKSVPQAVLYESLKKDFRNSYLFTGDIDPEIYDETCTFTDPTLSFEGLRTFETNLRNLRPYITRLVGANVVTLYALDRVGKEQIRAKWRMECCFAFPWRAVLDLCGETTYTFSGGRGGRIVDYSERWVASSAGAVLLQLLRSDSTKYLGIQSKLTLFDPSYKADGSFRSLSVDVRARQATCGGLTRACGSALMAATDEYAVYSSR